RRDRGDGDVDRVSPPVSILDELSQPRCLVHSPLTPVKPLYPLRQRMQSDVLRPGIERDSVVAGLPVEHSLCLFLGRQDRIIGSFALL
ncbi:MAG TPA: hypothetical protein VFA18_03420, partial [Gemmataceae bacterium]|nr:hypothetical protein [Gemmataceae bacterium]